MYSSHQSKKDSSQILTRVPKNLRLEIEGSNENYLDTKTDANPTSKTQSIADESTQVAQLAALQKKADTSSKSPQLLHLTHLPEKVDIESSKAGEKKVVQRHPMLARAAGISARAVRQVAPQVRGTFTSASEAGSKLASKMPSITGPVMPTPMSTGISSSTSSSGASNGGRLLGKLFTGVGIANAGYETYKAYNDEKTDGKFTEKGKNIALSAAGGAFGRLSVLGNVVSAYNAASKSNTNSVPEFFGIQKDAQNEVNSVTSSSLTPADLSMFDKVKALTSHTTDGPESLLHGMEVTSAAFSKFFPQVYQVAEKSKALKFLKFLPTVGIPLADIKTFAGNLIENQKPIGEFIEKHYTKESADRIQESYMQFMDQNS